MSNEKETLILTLSAHKRTKAHKNKLTTEKRFDSIFGDILDKEFCCWLPLIGQDVVSGWMVPKVILNRWSIRLLQRIPLNVKRAILLGKQTGEYAMPVLCHYIPCIELPHTSQISRVYNDQTAINFHRQRLMIFLLEHNDCPPIESVFREQAKKGNMTIPGVKPC